jgi:transposase InsO family protein
MPCNSNLVPRLNLTGIDQLWVADITYVRLREAFLYLAILMDAYSRWVAAPPCPSLVAQCHERVNAAGPLRGNKTRQ